LTPSAAALGSLPQQQRRGWSNDLLQNPQTNCKYRKIRENWQIIAANEAKLMRIVRAKWRNYADSQDIFQSAAALFAVRYRGDATQLGLIIRFCSAGLF